MNEPLPVEGPRAPERESRGKLRPGRPVREPLQTEYACMTVRNVPRKVMRRLKAAAILSGTSLQARIVDILTKASGLQGKKMHYPELSDVDALVADEQERSRRKKVAEEARRAFKKPVCPHGKGEGFECWRCGGPAVIVTDEDL